VKNVIPGLMLLFATQLFAASPQNGDVLLRLDPVTTLPALPVAFLVTLPVEVVELGIDHELPAVLQVTDAATGETFDAAFDDEANVKGWITLNVQSPPAKGMIEIQQVIDPPWGPNWFAEPKFRKPGTYRLRLRIIGTEIGLAEDLLSSEATLTVREPEGADAQAWAWLQSATKGGWTRLTSWSSNLMPKLVETFPSSEYARYGVGILVRENREPESQKWLQKAVELSENSWIGDYYRYLHAARSASWSDACGDDRSGTPRAEQRKCQSRLALEAAEKLRLMAAQTSSPSIRHLAEVERRRLQESARWIASVRD
jgi:hypothetical protein